MMDGRSNPSQPDTTTECPVISMRQLGAGCVSGRANSTTSNATNTLRDNNAKGEDHNGEECPELASAASGLPWPGPLVANSFVAVSIRAPVWQVVNIVADVWGLVAREN